MTGIDDIAAERRRQIEEEGWTAEHDGAEHAPGDLALAAACYAKHATRSDAARQYWKDEGKEPKRWPWASHWWKPKDRRRDLVRAGALIAAEIDRLDREAAEDAAPLHDHHPGAKP